MTLRLTALPLACVFFAGCTGASSMSGSSSSRSGGPGVELRITDAPSDEVTEIVVAIDHVEAHVASGGWQTIGNLKASIDLLKLQNGWYSSLGVSALPAGKLTQIRLYVDPNGINYVTTPDGAQHPLTVPSGEESGIKIKGVFDIPACAQGSITLDFDGKKSIFTHPKGGGAGDEWILRPVIRVKSMQLDSGNCAPIDPDAQPDPTPTGSTPTGGSTPTDSTPTDSTPTDSTPTDSTPSGSTPTGGSTPTYLVPVGDPTPLPPPSDELICTCDNASMYCYNGNCEGIIVL